MVLNRLCNVHSTIKWISKPVNFFVDTNVIKLIVVYCEQMDYIYVINDKLRRKHPESANLCQA